MKRIAPNLNFWLIRPVMRLEGGPLYTLKDLDENVTLKTVLNAHEIMDLEAAIAERAGEG